MKKTRDVAGLIGRVQEAAKGSEPEAKPVGASSAGVSRGRRGRVNVTGYFHPDVKTSLMLIRTHPDRRGAKDQDLLAEALNDLFAKHNVPQTAKLKPE